MFVFGSFLSPSQGLNLSQDILLALYLHTVSVHKHDSSFKLSDCQHIYHNILVCLVITDTSATQEICSYQNFFLPFVFPSMLRALCYRYDVTMNFFITYQKFTGVIADISS